MKDSVPPATAVIRGGIWPQKEAEVPRRDRRPSDERTETRPELAEESSERSSGERIGSTENDPLPFLIYARRRHLTI